MRKRKNESESEAEFEADEEESNESDVSRVHSEEEEEEEDSGASAMDIDPTHPEPATIATKRPRRAVREEPKETETDKLFLLVLGAIESCYVRPATPQDIEYYATLAKTLKKSKGQPKFVDDEKLFFVQSNDGKFTCPIGKCGREFTTVTGLQYHLKTYIHEVLDLLVAAYSVADVTDSQDVSSFEEQALARIKPEIAEVYKQVEDPSSLRLTFEFPVMFPGNLKPTKSLQVFGESKDRQMALEIDESRVSSAKKRGIKKSAASVDKKRPETLLDIKPNAKMVVKTSIPVPQIKFFVQVTKKEFNVVQKEVAMRFVSQENQEQKTIQSRSGKSIINREIPIFGTTKLSSDKFKREAHVFNAGGSVWALDWKTGQEEKEAQFLVCGGYKGNLDEHHAWNEQPVQYENTFSVCSFHNGTLKTEFVFLHDFGPVYDLKWCPGQVSNPQELLGLIAGVFGDGSLRVFKVPRREFLSPNEDGPIFVQTICPMMECLSIDANFSKLTWIQANMIAAGRSDGSVFVFNLENHQKLHASSAMAIELKPCISFFAHDSAVRWLEHIPSTDDNVLLLTCGNDGFLKLTDLNDPFNQIRLYKVLGFINSTTFSPNFNCIAIADYDNTAKIMEFSSHPDNLRNTDEDSVFQSVSASVVSAHTSCIWDTKVSHYMPFLCTCSADGSVSLANINRIKQRHGNRPAVQGIYRYDYNKENCVHVFIENQGSEEVAKVNTSGKFLYTPELSIHRVCWNPNLGTRHLVASAGVNGILRVDTVFGL